MGTLDNMTFKNQQGEQFTCQLVSVRGLTRVLHKKFTFAQLNAALSGNSLPFLFGMPINSIVKQVYYNVITTFTDNGTSGNVGTSTISMGLNTAVDLKAAATLVGGTLAAGIKAGIPINTVATMIKATADRVPTITWTAGSGDATALTAGELDMYVEFVVPAE